MHKIVFYITLLLVCLLLSVSQAVAVTSLSGEAELSYVDYKAKWDASGTNSQGSFSGTSLTQKYSLAYHTTNLYSRGQQRYYDVSLGYDLLSFDTNVRDGVDKSSISDTFGKFRYSGEIGYNPDNAPIKLRLFINDVQPQTFKKGLAPQALIDDGLTYYIDGKIKSVSSGVYMEVDPASSRSATMYGLPRFFFDYRETAVKSQGNVDAIDYKIRELAVAGLNKENNWLQYRNTRYTDFISSASNYEQQLFIIGLVDNTGRRKWSSLTNWIDVSADGQLRTKRALTNEEEYDVNFMAIASRRTWEARTFMNYNREMKLSPVGSDGQVVEQVRLPFYLKGLYGSDASWYMSMSTQQGRQIVYGTKQQENLEYSNTATAGGTMFSRSNFTLSPSITATSSKAFLGAETAMIKAAVESNSTARFSNKLRILTGSSVTYHDDGTNSATSKTWDSIINLGATYLQNNTLTYALKQDFGYGKNAGINGNPNTYWRTSSKGSVAWTPTAEFSTSFDVYIDYQKSLDSPNKSYIYATHRLSYDKQITSFHIDSKYDRRDEGTTQTTVISNTGTFLYRPDRYADAELRYVMENNHDNANDSKKIEVRQKYNYNFFSRTGVARNLATLTQEFSFIGNSIGGNSSYTQSLMLGGRYSPTQKLSLYGSTTYSNTNTNSAVIYYNVGMNANFFLLSSSLDYSYAKRDVDNRLEKKLMATVKRVF